MNIEVEWKIPFSKKGIDRHGPVIIKELQNFLRIKNLSSTILKCEAKVVAVKPNGKPGNRARLVPYNKSFKGALPEAVFMNICTGGGQGFDCAIYCPGMDRETFLKIIEGTCLDETHVTQEKLVTYEDYGHVYTSFPAEEVNVSVNEECTHHEHNSPVLVLYEMGFSDDQIELVKHIIAYIILSVMEMQSLESVPDILEITEDEVSYLIKSSRPESKESQDDITDMMYQTIDTIFPLFGINEEDTLWLIECSKVVDFVGGYEQMLVFAEKETHVYQGEKNIEEMNMSQENTKLLEGIKELAEKRLMLDKKREELRSIARAGLARVEQLRAELANAERYYEGIFADIEFLDKQIAELLPYDVQEALKRLLAA